MPPLVTVSAALLSTNTRSKRGRNFLNACPAMAPAAAVRTLLSRRGRKERPAVRFSRHVNFKKRCPARRRARSSHPSLPLKEGGRRGPRRDSSPGALRRPLTQRPRDGRKEELFLGFSRPPAEKCFDYTKSFARLGQCPGHWHLVSLGRMPKM